MKIFLFIFLFLNLYCEELQKAQIYNKSKQKSEVESKKISKNLIKKPLNNLKYYIYNILKYFKNIIKS